MSDVAALFLSFCAGTILGVLFFGGLWWTVRKALSSTQPATWFLCSLLLRAAIALSGFYFVSRGDWRKLVACLLGFLFARTAITRLARDPPAATTQAGQGGEL
jgi:F1F0 ATPase subunit 2